jgi:caffeoyl-CoA O-methyltransferase
MPDVLAPDLSRYIESLVPARPPELQDMETWAREHDFPIIGPACGHICYQIARMIGARRIFELGSGYGYSTAFFARAVKENEGSTKNEGSTERRGIVHHVVWDEELSARARKHLAALGCADVVTFHVAEAVSTLRQTEGPFDLIFNDIEKKDYPAALPVIEEKLRPGGVLIVDNMLWSGRVWDATERAEETEGVRALTRALVGSPRWVSSIIPIRDGLLIAARV